MFYSNLVTAMVYATSCFILQRYNGTRAPIQYTDVILPL